MVGVLNKLIVTLLHLAAGVGTLEVHETAATKSIFNGICIGDSLESELEVFFVEGGC